MVGYGCKNYPGYDKLTKAQLLDRAIRQRLLELHAQHAGFPLAEPNLEVQDALHVAEGALLFDGSYITVVGRAPGQELTIRGFFAAMNWETKVAWTTTPPALDATWIVKAGDIDDRPCLFIRSVRRVFLSSPCVPWWQRCGLMFNLLVFT